MACYRVLIRSRDVDIPIWMSPSTAFLRTVNSRDIADVAADGGDRSVHAVHKTELDQIRVERPIGLEYSLADDA